MNISETTLKALYEKYKDSFQGGYQKNQEAFNQAFQSIEDQLEGYFDWESLDEKDLNRQLLSLLEQTLLFNSDDNALKYDALNAKLACNHFAQQFNDATQLKLASPSNKLGIQENFLKSQLLNDGPLAKLDIQRHIVQTNMVGHIGVVDATTEALGLYIANARNKYEAVRQKEPLPVAMMVNCNPQGKAQWASVVIKINPQNNVASYEITHETTSGADFNEQLTQTIDEAIHFSQVSTVTGLPVTAYPEIEITPSSVKIAAEGTYQLLYQLYHAGALDDLVSQRVNALAFKNVPSDLTSIKQAVYDQQIRAIKIEPAVFNLFQASQQPQHPMVNEVIQAVNLTANKISFPGGLPETRLAAQDYQTFILLLKSKYDSAELDKCLKELEVNCFDIEALQGLARLKGKIDKLPFEKLILTLPSALSASDKAAFKFNMKLALIGLSESNLAKMQFNDPGSVFNEKDIEELTDFIKKNNMAIDLTLPGNWANSDFQRDIDIASSQFILDRNAHNFSNKRDAIEVALVARPLRTRPELSSKNISIDIELQQEVQVEVAVEASSKKARAHEDNEENEQLFSLCDFKKALLNSQFSLESKSYLIQAEDGAEKVWNNWLGYFDKSEAEAAGGMRISKPALEELMRHAEQFEYGVGFIKQGDEYRCLPAGFSVKKSGDGTFLDFSPKLKLITEQNLLAVQAKDVQAGPLLSIEQIQKWLSANPEHPFQAVWVDQLMANPYSKQTVQALQAALPKIYQMPSQQVEKLFELCKIENQIDVNKLNFLVNDAAKAQEILKIESNVSKNIKQYIEKLFGQKYNKKAITFIKKFSEKDTQQQQFLLTHLLSETENEFVKNIQDKVTSIQMNGLLQLYLQSGAKGLEDLSTLLDNAGNKLEFYEKIINGISARKGSYQQILTKEFQDDIQILSGLDDNERQFFLLVFEQHAQHNPETNFAELMSSFVKFKQELHNLAEPGKKFTFPSTCDLKDVKSMPLALSRIVALVRHVKQENRQAQLLEAHKLDLSSTGVIQAVTREFNDGKRWNFISEEMLPNQSRPFDNVAQSSKHIDRTGEGLSQSFFKYVAFQSKKGSLNLDFYKHADEKIRQKKAAEPWSDSSKISFSKLIAASTTTEANTRFNKDSEQAIKDFDALFEKIDRPPNPAYAMPKERMRNELLNILNNLDSIPPLPVLSRLVGLISKSLSTTVSVLKNSKKLLEANNMLKVMTSPSKYGDFVYIGMACYRDSDYDSGQLFFEHMDTIKAIDDQNNIHKNTNIQKEIVYCLLVQLISTFHLAHKNSLKNVFDALENLDLDLTELSEALIILNKIDPEKYATLPSLSDQDLIRLMQALKDKQYKSVMDTIKDFDVKEHKLSEYLDPRFIQNYGKYLVHDEIKQQIAGNFNQEVVLVVEDILLHFTNRLDADKYGTVVDKLIAICRDLPKLEQNLFLAKLNQAKGLYSTPLPLNDQKNHFMQLLEILEELGSPDELLNFIASDQALYSQLAQERNQSKFYTGEPAINQGLDKKAELLLRNIYPPIKFNQKLPFSKLEMTTRLQEWLLRTPVAQIDQESGVVHPDIEKTAAYLVDSQAFLDAMKKDAPSKKLNFEALKGQLAILDSTHVTNKGQLQTLKVEIEKAQETQFDILELTKIYHNPPAKQLLKYFSGSMDDKENDLFEKEHGDFIEQQVKNHPALLTNKELIAVMIDVENICLLKSTFQGKSLAALQSSELLTNEAQFNDFLTGLEEDVKAVKALEESVTLVHTEVTKYKNGLNTYPNDVLFLVDKMAGIVTQNPSARSQFLELFDKFVEHYDPAQGSTMMMALHSFVDQVAPVFAMIEDKNVVLALCMQFNGNEKLQPEDLLKLITTVKTVDDVEAQTLLINVAVNLLNNKKGYILGDGNGDDFTKLCALAKEERFIFTLQTFYKKPPYPALKQIIDIHNRVAQNSDEQDYKAAINIEAENFDKEPCHRELENNGFHVDRASEKIKLFKGYEASDEKLKGFSKKTVEMRGKSSDELLKILKAFHPDSSPRNKDMEALVAVAAELFYRSKGKDDPDGNGYNKLGSSMEINTTQYLAILSSLETKGHVTSQIGTGEGKSRIMMISNVCQWALGNTVDFVTSDAQLATRDYVEYQAYFNMVGAKTSMIFANSNPSSYQIGGINFSDPSNLSLFRNKAKSLGKGDQVLTPVATRRALMLDEADKTYFDVADTRFNFSKEGDESIQNMDWVYPILMEYFAQETVSVDKRIASTGKVSPQQLFYANVDASRESFLAFAGSSCSRQDYIRLKALSEQQIEQWQVSAVTASQLQFKKDFVIAPDQLIATPKGPKISSEAQLLFANRVARGSKFSFGVHQCLHARLNRLRQTPEKIDNEELRHALRTCEQGFYVADEKQIVYSSTSKNLIDDYAKGTLKAVTGTTGSRIERAEAQKLYQGMQFIDVPRAQGMFRQDKDMELCKDEQAQLDSLIKNIHEAQEKNQPILIIAENDEESGKLFDQLKKNFPKDIQRIHSQLSPKEEQEKTKEAGFPRKITVSTDMIGRGTDIELRKRISEDGKELSAEDNGLNVMVTYMPRVRDLQQIIGRSGRFGARGETSLILDEPRLLKKLGLEKLPQDYIRNGHDFIEREQAKMDRKAQVERLLKNHVGDFRMVLQRNYFDQMLTQIPTASKKDAISCWTVFFEKSDKAWNEVWAHIQKQLQEPNITTTELTEIERLLVQYKEATRKEWSTMVSKVRDLDISCIHDGKKADQILMAQIPDLALDDGVKSLFTSFKVYKKEVPHDNNRFKKILGGVLGFIGIAVGAALVATGILAPLGIGIIATVAIAAVAGGVVGGLAGVAGGAVVDRLTKHEPTEVIEISIETEHSHLNSEESVQQEQDIALEPSVSSYASIIMKKPELMNYVSDPLVTEAVAVILPQADQVDVDKKKADAVRGEPVEIRVSKH